MKTFDDYLDEVSKEYGIASFDVALMEVDRSCRDIVLEANKRYTTAAIKEHLSRAAENARTRTNDESTSIIVDRESITNIDTQLP